MGQGGDLLCQAAHARRTTNAFASVTRNRFGIAAQELAVTHMTEAVKLLEIILWLMVQLGQMHLCSTTSPPPRGSRIGL